MSKVNYTVKELNKQKIGREVWRHVVGYEGYYKVSNQGRVKSLPRQVRCNPAGRGWMVKPMPGKILKMDLRKGYLSVTLCKENIHDRRVVHHLVLEAFIGFQPEGRIGCHINDIQSDNRPENLYWGTASTNGYDAVRNGVHPSMGEKNHTAKMTVEKVKEIRALRATGEFYLRELGEMFGVNLSTIDRITKRETWKHVE